MAETHAQCVKRWEKYGKKHLLNKKIKAVRYLNNEELKAMGWNKSVIVIQLDDGTLIFPSADDEGNDGGALFGQSAKGEELTFPVIRSFK